MMSGNDEFDNTINDLIEEYLLYLRGRGPEPDLGKLAPDRRINVMKQLEIVAALADRDLELPSIEADPVAIRLGLVGSSASGHVGIGSPSMSDDDPVSVALYELQFRFKQYILLDFSPVWGVHVPAGMQPVAQCTALGEVIAVCIADVEEWSSEPEAVARFFRQHPEISAVGLVSDDAERAVVVTAADAQYSVDPVRGWLAPHAPGVAEPLTIALGRHIDRCLPEWDRVADLDELLDLGDLDSVASEISSAQVAAALRVKPRLVYKKEGLRVLSALETSDLVAIVVEVQSRGLAGEEVVDRVARLAEAAAR